MKLLLVDTKSYMCSAWREFFSDLPDVEIINSRFQDVAEYDCIVSPANSFGLMDGGMDAAITQFFGQKLMNDVQKRILTEFLGEQPVGTSIIVATHHPRHPWLAHTPTMRVPMDIARTDNVYLAMWALLRAVHHYNLSSEQPIERILCPGLGTGAGGVPVREAARQMSIAYRNYLNPPRSIDWRFASNRQLEIRYGGDMGLNIPPTS